MPLIHTCYRITDIDRSVAFYADGTIGDASPLAVRFGATDRWRLD
jgi:catechol 2,3-dioxygenase-like lactoylglutathione lyase family enzyme